jgi:hypothetical protein
MSSVAQWNHASQMVAGSLLERRLDSSLPAAVQAKLFAVVFESDDAAVSQLREVLVRGNGEAAEAADGLVQSLRAILPYPQRLPVAVVWYNQFVNTSSVEFLQAPPAEFLAIRSVLERLSTAGNPVALQ